MTLIPLISAIAAAPERVPAGARGGYDPGAGHRPLAALFAVGLPAALVVAVVLSPMIVADQPTVESPPWTSIFLPKPKPVEPEPQPREAAQPRSAQATETVDTLVPVPPISDSVVARGPVVPDPLPLPPGPSIDIARPAPPALVTAQVDPRFRDLFQPDYPLREQRAGIEGVVTVRVLIGTDGRVRAVELVRGDGPAFFEATKKRALSKWRFKPATRGGVAEESWREMTVRFQIRDA